SSCVDTTLTFKANVERRDKADISVIWDFGDGTTAEGLTVKHTYNEGGKYIVKAKAIDNSLKICNTAVAESAVRISAKPVAIAGEDIIKCFPVSQPALEVKFDGS
ncbi:MAG: PKD domain-containing protein, partial [Candidatus Omnitrophica bacterium]|nr:PKD domain-containing protein [Candidatus Omnitrophota bacterium]